MKKAIMTAILAFALGAFAVTGNYVSYLGYNAGEMASGNYTVLLGSFSAEGADGFSKSVFSGVKAGAGSSYLDYVFAGGFWAAANSTNITRSVAIGPSALRGTSNSSGVIAIGTDFFRDGTQYTNVTAIGDFLITSFGETYSTNGIDASQYDYFVAEYGNDAKSGTTLANAKHTLDGVISAATNGARIAVLAGHYAIPAACMTEGLTKALSFTAVHGAKKTRVDRAGESGKRFLHGARLTNGAALPVWTGFTFDGLTDAIGKGWNNEYKSAVTASIFVNCSFPNVNAQVGGSGAAFLYCVFSGCDISGRVIGNGDSSLRYGAIFDSCDLYDCTVQITTADNIYTSGPHLMFSTYWDNCYVAVDKVRTWSYGGMYPSVSGNGSAFVHTTLIVGQHGATRNVAVYFFNSLIGTLDNGTLQGAWKLSEDAPTVFTNATAVAGAMLPDHRPDWGHKEFYGVGYGAQREANAVGRFASAGADGRVSLLHSKTRANGLLTTIRIEIVPEDEELAVYRITKTESEVHMMGGDPVLPPPQMERTIPDALGYVENVDRTTAE